MGGGGVVGKVESEEGWGGEKTHAAEAGCGKADHEDDVVLFYSIQLKIVVGRVKSRGTELVRHLARRRGTRVPSGAERK